MGQWSKIAFLIIALTILGVRAGCAQAPGNPPQQASAAGDTRLDFYDDFNYKDTSFIAFNGASGKTWSAAAWYKPNSASPANFSVSNSVLTIHDSNISTMQNSPPYPARTWLGGYFEARIYCESWCGFYLGSFAWVKLAAEACGASLCAANKAAGQKIDSEYGGADEIDIIEAYSTIPNEGAFTLHKSGMGAGQSGNGAPDQTNPDNRIFFDTPLAFAWHVYGLLWTKEKLYWYLDNKLVKTAPAFKSTWQPSFMLFSAGHSKWGDLKKPDPVIEKIDWVRVWEPQ